MAAATAFRYFFEPTLALIVSPDSVYLFADAAIYFVSDALQISIVAILSAVLIGGVDDMGGMKLFGRIGSRKLSRVRLAAILSASLISAVKIGMRIRFDVFYGAPENFADLMWMITYYTLDILYGFVLYILILTAVKMLCSNK